MFEPIVIQHIFKRHVLFITHSNLYNYPDDNNLFAINPVQDGAAKIPPTPTPPSSFTPVNSTNVGIKFQRHI